jgi:hypothetical protein
MRTAFFTAKIFCGQNRKNFQKPIAIWKSWPYNVLKWIKVHQNGAKW